MNCAVYSLNNVPANRGRGGVGIVEATWVVPAIGENAGLQSPDFSVHEAMWGWVRELSMAEACWAPGVSKASINVRLDVQHKCHFVIAPLYL